MNHLAKFESRATVAAAALATVTVVVVAVTESELFMVTATAGVRGNTPSEIWQMAQRGSGWLQFLQRNSVAGPLVCCE